MHVAARPHVTAGIALAGAAVIAASPIAPPLPDIHLPNPHELQAAAVRLTAGWDPLAPWKTALNAASSNASTLADNFFLAPGVGLQQAIVNQAGFLNEVINDPSSIGTVLQQIATNAQTVASGITGVGGSAATNTAAQAHSVDALHGLLVSLLPGLLPAGTDVATVTQVLDVLASPASGLLMGAVGPVISPGVALLNSALAVGAALQASDPSAALSDLLNVPANVVGSFFNGADLNLDALVPVIAQSGLLPAGTTISALDVAFGGLLTVGSVSQGTYTTPPVPITTPGGSILNSLGLTVTTDALGVPLTISIPSHAVGPLGALESISQTAGVLLGDHWDGKNGVQTPPLAGLHFPTLSDLATAKDATAVNPLASLLAKLKPTSPVAETVAAENASASTGLVGLPKPVGLPKLHLPVTAPRTVPADTTGSAAAATDATATATGAAATGATATATGAAATGATATATGGSTSGKHAHANNPVRAAISNLSDGITKAVSGGAAKHSASAESSNGTGKSSASAGSSSGTGKHSASAGSSKGSGGGGRHRK
jgi:hypothetical protein